MPRSIVYKSWKEPWRCPHPPTNAQNVAAPSDVPQGLAMHRYQAHDVRGEKHNEPRLEPEALDEFEELVASIEAQAARVRERLAEVDAERDELLSRLRRFDGAVAKLRPPAKKIPRGAAIPIEQSIDVINDYLDRHAKEFPNGFGQADVFRGIRANGNAVIGKDRVNKTMKEMHQRNLITLHRRGPAGAFIYKRVGDA